MGVSRLAALVPWLEAEERDDTVKACRKATKRRFKELREPGMRAEVLALDLLQRRCNVCGKCAMGPT